MSRVLQEVFGAGLLCGLGVRILADGVMGAGFGLLMFGIAATLVAVTTPGA